MRKGPRARVSLSTIAAKAGVSVSTVSRIANGQLHRASPQTVARIKKLVHTLDYRPDTIARSLRRGESQVVAMLAPNLDNPAMGAIAQSTEAALRAAGYVMILCDTHDEARLQDSYIGAMRDQHVKGYVVVSAVASQGLADLISRGEPVVLAGRRQPKWPRMRRAAFVGIDNRSAGADAADFLLRSGVEVPAVIHASLSSTAIADRVAGFVDRVVSTGVKPSRIRKVGSNHLQHLQAGYEAAQTLVRDGGWPRGLLCASDMMAYGAYRVAREASVDVPGQCLIVGVDENPLNAWIAPWLSSVHVPYEAFGEAIVEQLQASWAGAPPSDRLLPHRLVIRR
jgi:LacI family transcriptional regulator